jgi:hypothetical protein
VEKAITELKVGEALVSTLDDDGAPGVVQRTLIAPPRSRLGPVSAPERAAIQASSPVEGKYDTAVNRESAAEVLAKKAADAAAAAQQVQEQGTEAQRAAPRQSPSLWDKAGKAAIGAVASSAGAVIAAQISGKKPALRPSNPVSARWSARSPPAWAAPRSAASRAACWAVCCADRSGLNASMPPCSTNTIACSSNAVAHETG